MTRAMTTAFLTLAAAVMLAGCGHGHPAVGAPVAGGPRAVAMLHDATGAAIGRATATEVGGGLRVTIDARGLPPGLHGAQIATIGVCDAPRFTAAGGRWTPTSSYDGGRRAADPHESDLPDLVVGRDGRGTLGVLIAGATMAGLLDADGAAMIVEAGPNDATTGGGRITCGVFVAA